METKPKTILYADDDPDDLAMFRQAVAALGTGYTIIEANDGLHALELLQQLHHSGTLPCLIVLDINMPRMDGKQTLVAIQNHPDFASIPIVLYSTSSSVMDKTFSQSRQVELITKPFSFDRLFGIVSRVLSYCKM